MERHGDRLRDRKMATMGTGSQAASQPASRRSRATTTSMGTATVRITSPEAESLIDRFFRPRSCFAPGVNFDESRCASHCAELMSEMAAHMER